MGWRDNEAQLKEDRARDGYVALRGFFSPDEALGRLQYRSLHLRGTT